MKSVNLSFLKSLPLGLLAGVLVGIVLSGCRIDSPNSTSRNVQINVGGVYTGDPLVTRNSGARIIELNVIQNGSNLQAVDNNGLIFRGNIGSVTGGGTATPAASFTLRGQTTTGAEGVISGNFTVSGSRSTMRGTWAEPSLFGNVSGTAEVGAQPETTPPPTNGTNSASININNP